MNELDEDEVISRITALIWNVPGVSACAAAIYEEIIAPLLEKRPEMSDVG